MPALAIIAQCILVAIAYGIAHDQITARVCVEYFTVGHPPVFATTSPTLLGLGWGVIATWWVGAMLGVPLAIAARAGSWPKVGPRDLWLSLAVLVCVMAMLALASGITGYVLARRGSIWLFGELAEAVPPGHQSAFLADWWAHSASYFAGFVGGVVVIARTALHRKRFARALASGAASAAVS